ncbi:hypothetical protein HWV62_22908 [Athelia sp. TMB]|nr:hypothetical protein HWV62_22908 [Athelia sp. TMB]
MQPTQLPFIPVIIIGGGFSGLAMGAQLKRKLNFEDYILYDRSPDLGGTWWANRYPGCGVDIPSIYYSLSFAPNPDFTQFFPEQPEILQYIKSTAKKFGVDKHAKFNTSWDGAVWQEATKTWIVRLSDTRTGEIFSQECRVLISGTGALVNPNPCEIPGVDSFDGPVVHTAKWPQDLNIEGKEVVVIGNGCSATQVVPAIAPHVKSVHQFMRSPQFFLPRPNPTIGPVLRWIFRYVPFVQTLIRWMFFHIFEYTVGQFYLSSRGARHRRRWQWLSDWYLESCAPKQYWDILKPNYLIGCKRRVFDPGYLTSLRRDNVRLTNAPIVKIDETGVVTKSGQHYPADVIVLATGFQISSYNVNLVGRDGVTPTQHWAKFGGVEAVVDLILKVAGPVIKGRVSDVAVKLDYEKEFSDTQQKALSQRVWVDCKSVSELVQRLEWLESYTLPVVNVHTLGANCISYDESMGFRQQGAQCIAS